MNAFSEVSLDKNVKCKYCNSVCVKSTVVYFYFFNGDISYCLINFGSMKYSNFNRNPHNGVKIALSGQINHSDLFLLPKPSHFNRNSLKGEFYVVAEIVL